MSGYPFLKENIEALKAMDHPIYNWLFSQQYNQEDMQNRLFENAFGLVDWRMDNELGMFEKIPVHGLYNRWIVKEKAHTSATIVIGCNLGYGINHLLQNTPDSHKIIVLEPRAEMLITCLGQTDYRPFFENRKLHFCLPDEKYIIEVCRNLDLQYLYGQVHMRTDVPSQQLGPDYAQWARIVKHRLENFTVELATLRHRQDVMVGNELQNFQRSMSDGSLLPLQNRGKGVSAVILGAGPSLKKFGPELAENPGNALYTTALQTLPALYALGIKPHFCLAIDYDSSMLNVYDRLDKEWASDITLIYSTKCNPELVNNYPGPTLPLWTMGGMGTFTMQDHELVLDAGGNVSLTLLRFLRFCGVSQILYAGQDFAWRDQSHSEGHHNSGKTIPFNPKYHQKTVDADGNEIISSVQYLTSKREIEEDIRNNPFPVYNLYGGGVVIKGTRRVDMNEVRMEGILASAPGAVDRFLGDVESCRRPLNGLGAEPRSHEWTTSLRNVEKRLSKLFRKCGRNQSEIHDVLEQVTLFLKHDPLYMPYLYNETLDIAGLTRAKASYETRDLGEFKRIMKKVLRKVREVDRCITTSAAVA